MIEYRQKSKIFLFPLLGIPNSAAFKPTNTYLQDLDKGIELKEYKLIVCYDRKHAENNKEYYSAFESKMLIGNKLFLEMYDDGQCLMYVFDMGKFKKDYDSVVNGKYTKITDRCKHHIDKYHTSHIGPNAYIRRYLFPSEKSYEFFANELGVNAKDLQDGVELCSAPDMELETVLPKVDNLFV